MKSDSKKFDQFYTKIEIAKEVLEETLLILKKLNYKKDNILFVEPSAGNGSFIEVIRNKKMPFLAYDIDVKKEYIKKNNFLTQDISKDLPIKDKVVIIGNPPFGKRAKLAIDFINTAFKYTDTVAFILPLQFNKYSAQKEINHSANLVFHKKLNEKSFIYLEKEYSVRCCLQVWTKKTNLQDLRIRKAPQIEHQDFKM